jgi:hypothetical protein
MTEKRSENKAEAPRRFDRGKFLSFCLALAALLGLFFSDTFIHGKFLSPADLLLQKEGLVSLRQTSEPAHRLMSDSAYQFLPWQKLTYISLAGDWRVPFRNPYTYCGSPHFANLIASPLCPTRAVPSDVSPRLNAALHSLELLLAGIGMYLLLWALGVGELSRWFGGMAWTFSGFLVVWKLWPQSAAAYPLTWLLLGLVLAEIKYWRASLLVTACSVALSFLGGHPQTTSQMLFAAGTYALYRVFTARDWRLAAGAGAWWLAGVGVGAGLAAFFLIPAADYLTHSYAWGTRVENALPFWSWIAPDWRSLPGQFFPYLFGSRLAGYLPLDRVIGATNTNEIAGAYVCWLLPVALLPLAFFRRRRIPEFGFWAGWWAAAMLLAISFPVITQALRLVPVLGSAAWQRLLLFGGLALVIVAARLLDDLLVNPLSKNEARRLCLGLGGFALCALLTAGVMRSARNVIREKVVCPRLAQFQEKFADNPVFQNETADSLIQRLEKTTVAYPAWIGVIALAGLAGVLAAGGAIRNSLLPRGSLLLAVVLLDLFWFGRNYTPAISPGLHYPVSEEIAYLQKNAVGYRLAASGERALPPNVFMAYGLSDIRGYDAIEPREYMDFCVAVFGMEKNRPPNFRFLTHRDYTHPLADFLGVKYLLSDRPLAERDLVSRTRFRQVFQTGDTFIYENTRVMPGLYLAENVEFLPDAMERLRRLQNWRHDSFEAVVEEVSIAKRYATGGTITARSGGGDEFVFEADLSAPGFAVFAQTWLRDWNATVNGKDAKVYRTNHAFLGLQVPAGKSEIRLSYRPHGLTTGIAVSLAAVLCLLALLVAAGRKSVIS